MRLHHDLSVWQRAGDFVTRIYEVSNGFPREEIYGLTNQLRWAAVSVPLNIAEGAARQTNKEFIRFLYIAQGSLSELETQLLIAKNLEYLNEETFKELEAEQIEISKMLAGLIKYRMRK